MKRMLFVFFFFAPVVSLAGTVKRTPTSKIITAQDYLPKIVNSGKYASSWTLWGWNKLGWKVQLVFFVSRVHLLAGIRGGVQVTVVQPNKPVVHKFLEVKSREILSSKKKFRIKIRKSYWKGSPSKGKLRVRIDGLELRLKYTNKTKPIWLFQGGLKLGSQAFRAALLSPKATMTGTIKVAGKKHKFVGVGLVDHSHQGPPHKTAKRWYTIRGFGKDYQLFMSRFYTPNGWSPSTVSSIDILHRGKWMKTVPGSLRFSILSSRKDSKNGYSVPVSAKISQRLTDGSEITIFVKKRRLYHRLDTLKHVPKVVSFFIRRLIANPFLYRQEVDIRLVHKKKAKLIRRKLQGLAEISILNR